MNWGILMRHEKKRDRRPSKFYGQAPRQAGQDLSNIVLPLVLPLINIQVVGLPASDAYLPVLNNNYLISILAKKAVNYIK